MDRKSLILSGIAKLADSKRNILGIVSCGSFSRGDMDRYSDIDLYIFTKSIVDFTDRNNNDWLNALGDILSIRIFKDRQEGVDKIKLILVGGLMFDLTIVSSRKFSLVGLYLNLVNWGLNGMIPNGVSRLMESNINTFYETIRRGYEVHVDKIGIRKVLGKAVNYIESKRELNAGLSLTRVQFENSYHLFWQSCYTASVKLIRGDYFYVVLVYDHYLKQQLVRMVEWGESISRADQLDYFYNAYKIRDWGGEQLYNRLKFTLFSNSVGDMLESILQMIEIYQEYAGLVARTFEFKLNHEFEQFVINFVQEALLNVNDK